MTEITAPHMHTDLLPGESLLAAWRPNLALFAQRALLLSFVTALALSSLGYLSLLQWLVAVPVFTVIFVFVFDDHTVWFRHRGDVWYLTSERLIFERANAPEENAAVPLFAVEWMQPWAWWSLRIGFEGGTSTAMRFVRRPRAIKARIEAAQAALASRMKAGGGDV